MTDAPQTDERIQIVRCVGCEQVSLPGQCDSDAHGRLECPRCASKIPAEAFHDYIHSRVMLDE